MIILLFCTAKIEKNIGICKKSSKIIFNQREFVQKFGQFIKNNPSVDGGLTYFP